MEFDIVKTLLDITLMGTEWVLWLLIGLSILSITIVFERLIFFWNIRINFSDFAAKLTQYLVDDQPDNVRKLCEGHSSLEGRVVMRGIERRGASVKSMEESMAGFLLSQKQQLDRGLVVLGTLGNNAPFIGLFGTVLGIIQAFKDLADNPAGGPSVVMAGISEALVATAIGLLVAIPAVVAFNAFQRIVKRHIANSEAVMKIILSHHSP